MTNVYYHKTHNLPVGRKHWKWSLNQTARFYVFLAITLATYLLMFQFVLPTLHLMQNDNVANQAFMDTLDDHRNFVLCLIIIGVGGGGLLYGPPSVGCFQNQYFMTDIRVDEYGIKFRLGKSTQNDSCVYMWAWACLWRDIKQIDFHQQTTPDCNCRHTMSITGDACVLELLDTAETKTVSPHTQQKIFGGENKITVELGDHISDILSALKQVEDAEGIKIHFIVHSSM